MKYLASVIAAGLVWTGSVAVSAAGQQSLDLTGAMETPPVTTKATGTASFTVDGTGVVSGTVKTKGIHSTAAHIHTGEPGQSGPPAITLKREGKEGWVVPEGSKLSADQYAAYKKGGLYINVHSKAHPEGEIRAQLAEPSNP